MLDEASTNLPHPRNPVESACCIHRMAVIHWSNVDPDLGGRTLGGVGVRSGPRSRLGLRAALTLLPFSGFTLQRITNSCSG
jgi:hypothetical protein